MPDNGKPPSDDFYAVYQRVANATASCARLGDLYRSYAEARNSRDGLRRDGRNVFIIRGNEASLRFQLSAAEVQRREVTEEVATLQQALYGRAH